MAGKTTESVTNVCRNGKLSETVILAVAEATGVDPLELDSLYSVIDPDALNAMFRSSDGSPSASLELTFSMAGCHVVVRGGGEVVVTPAAASDESQVTVPPREE